MSFVGDTDLCLNTLNRHLKRMSAPKATTSDRLVAVELVGSSLDASDPPPLRLLEEFALTPGAYYLVVCRFEPENHVREMIAGYSRAARNWPLVLVGDCNLDTPYVRSLKACANRQVRFVGTVYDRAKLTALRCFSTAYCHGHSVGGTNPSLLEAMGAGNLIVAHDNPFNREVLGSNAFFFASPGDLARRSTPLKSAPTVMVT